MNKGSDVVYSGKVLTQKRNK